MPNKVTSLIWRVLEEKPLCYFPRYHWRTAALYCLAHMHWHDEWLRVPDFAWSYGAVTGSHGNKLFLAESDYNIWMCSHEQIVVFRVEQQFQRYFLLRAFLRNVGLCNYYLIRYVESNFVGSGSPDGVCLFQPHVAGVSTSLLTIHVSCLLMFIWNCCYFLCRIWHACWTITSAPTQIRKQQLWWRYWSTLHPWLWREW